jgi:hypothetical protein
METGIQLLVWFFKTMNSASGTCSKTQTRFQFDSLTRTRNGKFAALLLRINGITFEIMFQVNNE